MHKYDKKQSYANVEESNETGPDTECIPLPLSSYILPQFVSPLSLLSIGQAADQVYAQWANDMLKCKEANHIDTSTTCMYNVYSDTTVLATHAISSHVLIPVVRMYTLEEMRLSKAYDRVSSHKIVCAVEKLVNTAELSMKGYDAGLYDTKTVHHELRLLDREEGKTLHLHLYSHCERLTAEETKVLNTVLDS